MDLRENGSHINPEIDYSENCRRAGSTFIDHSVARSRFMAAIEVAQRTRDDIQLIDAADIIARAPEKTQRAKHPLKWTAPISDDRGGEVAASLISDDLFALAFPDGTASYFVVEIDRGQMPVRRNGESAEETVGGRRRLRT